MGPCYLYIFFHSHKINLLDTKRSMNINIFLKQFKASNEAIVDMIRKGDESQFGSERLKGLIRNLPLKDEVLFFIIILLSPSPTATTDYAATFSMH